MTSVEKMALAFKMDGYLTGIQISDTAEATTYRQAFDALEAEVGRETAVLGLRDWHLKRKFIWELATHPKLLDCIEALIGPGILLIQTYFICKYGPSHEFFAWHQDITHMGLEPPEMIGIWYAIDDSDPENGCVRVIPGSHTYGILDNKLTQQTNNLALDHREAVFDKEDEKLAVELVLNAGEVSIQNGMTLHSSLPNRSKRRRCGLGAWYISTQVKQVQTYKDYGKYSAILVRGHDRYKNYNLCSLPF